MTPQLTAAFTSIKRGIAADDAFRNITPVRIKRERGSDQFGMEVVSPEGHTMEAVIFGGESKGELYAGFNRAGDPNIYAIPVTPEGVVAIASAFVATGKLPSCRKH